MCLMSDMQGSSVPYRDESFKEIASKKAAILIPFYMNRVARWLITQVTNVFRFVLSLIPEALGKDPRRR